MIGLWLFQWLSNQHVTSVLTSSSEATQVDDKLSNTTHHPRTFQLV